MITRPSARPRDADTEITLAIVNEFRVTSPGCGHARLTQLGGREVECYLYFGPGETSCDPAELTPGVLVEHYRIPAGRDGPDIDKVFPVDPDELERKWFGY